jgi:hypothetical protein
MPARYFLEVNPRRVLLGEPVTAVLRCVAQGDSADVYTFDHKTLVLELDAEGLIEPRLTFPNRFAFEEGGKLIRTSPPGGIEDLRNGEERTRSFDLADLFPEVVLNVGTISIAYRLEEPAPPVRPTPVTVELESGPEAVPLLIGLLDSKSPGVRFRAAQLLRGMSAREFGDDADWAAWWAEEGALLPWNYESSGATFGEMPSPPPPNRRSGQLGGVAHPSPTPPPESDD